MRGMFRRFTFGAAFARTHSGHPGRATMRHSYHILFFALLCVAAGRAHAAMTSFGDFTGTTVKYINFAEESVTDPLPLFGPPVISGDVLDFSSVTFGSFAAGGLADTTTSKLTTQIEALAGHALGALDIVETGDFELLGLGGVLTSATVGAVVEVEIVEVDGAAITPVMEVFSVDFTPSNGGWNLAQDGPGPLVEGLWSGSGHLDLGVLLLSKGITFSLGATRVNVALTNQLTTSSENGTAAFIAKKDIGATIEASSVPEPSAIVLGVSAVIAFAMLARRRKS